MFLHVLAKNWWMLLVRGLFAILFGLLAYAWPGLTLLVLIVLFGIHALVDGVIALSAAMTNRGASSRTGLLVITGLLDIAFALIAFFWPGETALFLILLIGAWAVIRGIFEIVAAIQLRKEISNEWLWILGGILSLIFGLFVIAAPGAGALALVWVIASYAILFGILMIAFSLRLKGHVRAIAV